MSKLVGKVPVEPLDDERLVAIERRVVANAAIAPQPRGWGLLSRHLVPLAVSAAAIAIAIAVGWTLRGVPELGGNAGNRVAVDVPPVNVHAGTGGAMLDIGDAAISSGAGTELAITRPDGGVLVAMAHGEVDLQVAKRHDRPPLVVRAGDTDVVVVGTKFSVAWDGHGPVEVNVTEGVVRCLHGGHEARVAAGEKWSSDTEIVAMASAPNPSSAAASSAAAGGAGDPHPASASIEIDSDPSVTQRNHVATVPQTPQQPSAAATGSGRVDGSAAAFPTRHPAGSGATDPRRDLKSEIRAQELLPATHVDAADPGAAIAEYAKAWSKSFDDNAEHALYSAALVDSLQLGHDPDALRLLDLYVRRFATKRDDVTTAAFWLRVRILCLNAVDDRCRTAAAAYTQRGGGPAEHVVELITATE